MADENAVVNEGRTPRAPRDVPEGLLTPEPDWTPLLIAWIWSVALGLTGLMLLGSLWVATPLGWAVIPPVGLFLILLSVEIWRRRRWAWWTLMGLHVAAAVGCLLRYDPANIDEGVSLSVAMLVILLTGVWTLGRGGCFRSDAPRRPLFTPLGWWTGSLVLMTAVGGTLLLYLDDPLRPHPELEFQLRSVAPADNAARLLPDLHMQLGEPGRPSYNDPEYEEWLRTTDAVPDPEDLQVVDAFLAAPDLVIGDDFDEDGFYRGIENAAGVRHTARALAAAADVAAEHGRPQEAMSYALRAARAGKRCQTAQGVLISFLMGRATTAHGLHAVRSVVNRARVDADLVRRTLAELPTEDGVREAFREALAMERITSEAWAKQVDDGERGNIGLKSAWPLTTALWKDAGPWMKRNMTLNLLSGALAAVVPLSERETYSPLPPRSRTDPFDVTPLHRIRNHQGLRLAADLTLARNAALQSLFGGLAENRLTRITLALRLYQIDHGTLPATLDELAPDYLPELPEDPFTGKAFGYAPDESPPALYSAGPNGARDDWVQKEYHFEVGDDTVILLKFAAGDEEPASEQPAAD